jgi:hypothetical protein
VTSELPGGAEGRGNRANADSEGERRRDPHPKTGFRKHPGFVTEELPPWSENGEVWRPLKATFPANVVSHTREQVSYFGPDKLLRRHEYAMDVPGGTIGVNYAADYRPVGEIVIPVTSRVYAADAERRKIAEPALVSIDPA